jgi:hypothetical protein
VKVKIDERAGRCKLVLLEGLLPTLTSKATRQATDDDDSSIMTNNMMTMMMMMMISNLEECVDG